MTKVTADVIIIGGGAAGLMAAAGAARTIAANSESGKASGRVVVLEKMPRPGRKIMITGKGRCNFTNVKAWNEFQEHVHPKPGFLKSSFYNLTSEKMLSFMEENGLSVVVERGDRAFPESHLASDVVDALVRAAQSSGAQIQCNKEVSSIATIAQKAEGSAQEAEAQGGFEVRCADGSEYVCRKLIICSAQPYPSPVEPVLG